MDLKIIKLSLERLLDKVDALENENQQLAKRVEALERDQVSHRKIEVSEKKQEDELLDTKDVLKMLGVCYNTLRKITIQKLINPIRISTKRVKYSKAEVIAYINSRSD